MYINRWAQKECEKQELETTPENNRLVLKGLLKHIRFPLMSSKDFAVHVAPSEILSDKEMISLLIQYSIPASERANLPLLPHGFLDRERKSSQPPKKKAKTNARSPFPDSKGTVVSVDAEDPPKDSIVNGTSTPAITNGAAGSDWRNPMAGLKFNLMSMHENHYKSDITFTVGENREKVFAHKFILSLWSQVFEQMFQQRSQPADEPIEIMNFNASGFRSFLKVAYFSSTRLAVAK